MTSLPPALCIPVGIVVERRKALSRWADYIWRPVAMLAGVPDADPWTILAVEGDSATFYAGAAEIALYRSETEGYRRNLTSGAPSVWVALHPAEGDPPYRLAAVTADPAEGEALTEPGQGLVEPVAMAETLRDTIAAFVAGHHVEHPFEKRTRDRADPEALARRRPRTGNDDER